MTTTEKKKLGPCDVLTPTFRASYLNVFEPRSAEPGNPNAKKDYGVEMWFRVKDTPESLAAGEKCVNIQDLVAAANAAATERWGVDKTKWPKFKYPVFKKGEDRTGKGGPIPGVVIVRAKRAESFGRPIVVDQNVKDIIDKNQVYSGCYMMAKLHAFAWPPAGKPSTFGNGVSFTLDMLQLDHDGEPLGNKMAAADAFESIAVPAGSAQAPAQGAEAADTFGGLG